MSKTITSDIPADNTVELQAAIDKLLVEIQRNNDKMERDQQDIERMKARTRGMLEQLEKL